MDWTFWLGVLGGLLLLWLLLLGMLWVFRPRDVPLGQIIRLVPDLLRLIRLLLSDRDVPLGARIALIGLLVWLINPLDLIPDFIPALGAVDDAVVAVLVLRYVRRALGADELRRRWPGTPDGYAVLAGALGWPQ